MSPKFAPAYFSTLMGPPKNQANSVTALRLACLFCMFYGALLEITFVLTYIFTLEEIIYSAETQTKRQFNNAFTHLHVYAERLPQLLNLCLPILRSLVRSPTWSRVEYLGDLLSR